MRGPGWRSRLGHSRLSKRACGPRAALARGRTTCRAPGFAGPPAPLLMRSRRGSTRPAAHQAGSQAAAAITHGGTSLGGGAAATAGAKGGSRARLGAARRTQRPLLTMADGATPPQAGPCLACGSSPGAPPRHSAPPVLPPPLAWFRSHGSARMVPLAWFYHCLRHALHCCLALPVAFLPPPVARLTLPVTTLAARRFLGVAVLAGSTGSPRRSLWRKSRRPRPARLSRSLARSITTWGWRETSSQEGHESRLD